MKRYAILLLLAFPIACATAAEPPTPVQPLTAATELERNIFLRQQAYAEPNESLGYPVLKFDLHSPKMDKYRRVVERRLQRDLRKTFGPDIEEASATFLLYASLPDRDIIKVIRIAHQTSPTRFTELKNVDYQFTKAGRLIGTMSNNY